MMKTKHRRLFGQNNRNARHFYSLSAKSGESLRSCVKILTVSVFSIICVAPAAQSRTIESQIEQHVEEQLNTTFPAILPKDRSFQVNYPANLIAEKDCDSDLVYKWRNDIRAGANTLHISCQEPSWQAYLPISVQAFTEVVVAKASLNRSNTIEANQLTLKRVDIGSLRMGYFTNPLALNGYELQRTVKAGQVLTPYIVKAPMVVNRGDWVTIISGKGRLTVTTTGEALKDGSIGDQIPVKNLRTEQKVRAWILKKGVVTTKKDLL